MVRDLYEGREIFEAVNKGLSFVATSEYPWFRAPSSRHARRILDENPEVAEHVLERIRAEGPLSSLDFERRRGAETDWFGAPTNVVRAVVEAYTDTGILGLARREGSRRYYDLLERLVPATVLRSEIPFAEQLRHKMHSRYRAHGLLGATSGGDVFGGLGPAKPRADRPAYPGRTALREQLIESGALVAVDVEGVRGTRYVLEDEVRLLEDPPEPTPSVGFLSPFDPLVRTASCSRRCSGSTTSGTSSTLPRSALGWYVLRSSSARASSADSSRASTATASASRCSVSGGSTASRHAAPTASSRRCGRRSPRTARRVSRLGWPAHLAAEKRLLSTPALV